MNSKE